MYDRMRLIRPSFDDEVTGLIIDLDYLRKGQPTGTTPLPFFVQLKGIFHMLEGLGSARIEGNRTTIAQAAEDRISQGTGSFSGSDERIREYINVERSLDFLETIPKEHLATAALTRELHKRVVDGLSTTAGGEGSSAPGAWRSVPVSIAGSRHRPPQPGDVPSLMDELFSFLAAEDEPRYDLIKLAIAHHRMAWIHPFDNGNGRTIRLFTYGLLIRAGFRVAGEGRGGRILQPTAVFCSNREAYYDALAGADGGDEAGLLSWCRYVLKGLKAEIEKIDRLSDYGFLRDRLLLPAIDELADRDGINGRERSILRAAALGGAPIANAEARTAIGGGLSTAHVSRIIAGLRERRLLVPEAEGGRSYSLGFSDSPLLRTIMRALDREGFLPFRGEI